MVDSAQLKRTVTIKAVVTEDFKKYLQFELDRGLKNLDHKLAQVESQAKRLIENLEKNNNAKQASAVKQQLELERQQHAVARKDLEKRGENAKNLKLDTLFLQGTIEGFVKVKVGENLYKKLGAMEIIIKDGIIQEIKGVDS